MSKQASCSLNPFSPRADDWLKVFGRTENIPLKGYLPYYASVPGRPKVLVYDLDLSRITDDERARLVEHLSQRFGVLLEEVNASLDQHGCPILAEDVSVAIPMRLVI